MYRTRFVKFIYSERKQMERDALSKVFVCIIFSIANIYVDFKKIVVAKFYRKEKVFIQRCNVPLYNQENPKSS